jgi:CBS domain-containing protein
MLDADSPVAEVMSTVVLSVAPGTTLHDLRAGMLRHALHFVPVLEAGAPVGVVTPWDLLGATGDVTAAEVMVGPPVCIRPSTTVAGAARRMRYHAIHHLLVVADGRMVGSVSSFDLLLALAGDRA